MSDPIHHLKVLHNNPFIFSSILLAFFNSLGNKERGLLLGYLVLPLALSMPSRVFLKRANSRSTIRSMMSDRSRIFGLEKRIKQYRWLTQTTFQYLLDSGFIAVHDQLNVSVCKEQLLGGPAPEGTIKAARRLGMLFQPYDVPTIYRMLGVMCL